MKTAVVILAAGEATRMFSRTPKYMHEIGGLPIIDHILETCKNFDFSHKILVTNPKFPLKRKGWDSVVQGPLKGTGAAVLAAKEKLADFKGNVLVLYSDCPFISTETIKKMLEKKESEKNGVVSLVFEASDPKTYGRIVLKEEKYIDKIVEFKDATEDEKKITLCNGGNLLADRDLLFSCLEKTGNNNPAGEYWLTDIVGIANGENHKCGFVLGDESEFIGVNTREELAIAENFFQQKKRKEIMNAGVSLLDPETIYFSYDTVIGKDCVIEPCVYFAPGVFIGANSRIPAFSRIEKSKTQLVRKYEPVFSFKMIIFIIAFVMVIFSPFIIWLNADDEKKGLCVQSLEMCIINSKKSEDARGFFGCVYGNLQCLVRDIDTTELDKIAGEELQNSEDIDPEYLEKFLKNYK